MPDRTLRAILTGDSAGMEAAFAKGAAAADAAEADMSSKFDEGTSKVGGLFSKLGNTMSNFGLPFGSSLSKMGAEMDEAKSHGSGLATVMSDVGKTALAVGAVGLAAVAVASVDMADKFDTARASMDTAIKDSGGNLDKLNPSIETTYGSMAKLGFNMTDTASAMTPLIVATGSTATAEKDMGLAADLARMKHISLSDAVGTITKVYAGSTRALTQLGLNLDIGTGKLSSIQTATEGVTKAQLALQNTQEGIADGSIKAAQAHTTLQSAELSLSDAELKLQQDHSTIGTILDTVASKTKGAAAAFGDTLGGQIDEARAETHNLEVEFGEELIPKLDDVIQDVASTVDWFEKHKLAAEVLAGVIGGVLAAAIAVYLVNVGQNMVEATGRAITSLQNLGQKFLGTGADAQTSAGELDGAGAQADAAAADFSAAGTQADTAAGEFSAAASQAQGAGTQLETAGAEAETAGGEFEAAGVEAQTAGGEFAGLGATSDGELAGGLSTASGEAEALGGSLGALPIAAGLAAGGLGVLIGKLTSGFNFSNYTNEINSLSSDITTLGGSGANLYQLETGLDQVKQKLDAIKGPSETTSGNQVPIFPEGTLAAIDQYDSKLKGLQDDIGQYKSNLATLGGQFDLTNSEVASLAGTIGVSLDKAFDPSEMGIFRSALVTSGTGVDTLSGKFTNMSANAENQFLALESSLKTTLDPSLFTGVGEAIDTGLAGGITKFANAPIQAMQSLTAGVLSIANETAQTKSPSRVTMETGQNIADGLALGINSKAAGAVSAAAEMSSRVVGAVGSSATSAAIAAAVSAGPAAPSGASTGDVGGTMYFSLNMDGQELASNAVFVQNLRTALLQGKKAVVSLGFD